MRILSVFFFLVFFSDISAQNLPKWYKTGKIAGYDSESYLLGFGVGSDFSESSSKAQEQIAAQINNEIKSEINIIEQEVSKNNISLTKSEISQSITTNVNQSIAGATILARAVSNGKHYTASGLSKAFFISSLEFKVMELEQTLDILYDQAKKGLSSGQLEFYFKNKSMFEKALVEMSATQGILRSFGNPSFSIIDEDFEMLINEVKGIDLTIVAGQKQAVVLGFPFKDLVSVQATMDYSGKEVPLVNYPIRTIGIEPKEIKSWTDSKGIALFRLPASFSDDDAKSISFELLKSQLPGNGKGLPRARPPSLRFTTVNTLPLMFDLEFIDESSGSKKAISDVKKKITKTIISLGHSIAENDKLLLRNTISVESPKEIDGKDGTMYLVTGELFVELISVQKNEVLTTITTNSRGLHKDSQKKALEKAVKNMKLSKRDFGKIINEADTEIIAIMTDVSKNSFEKGKANFKLRKFDKAMDNLIKVNFGDDLIIQSKKLMDEIQIIIQKEEKSRIQRELAEREKERQFKLEQERIKAQAKVQAEKFKSDIAWAEMKEAQFKKESEKFKPEVFSSIQNNNNPSINSIELDSPFNKLSPYDQIILFLQPSASVDFSNSLSQKIDENLVGSWELTTALKNDGNVFKPGKDSEFLIFRTDGTFNGFGIITLCSSNIKNDKIILGDKEIKFQKDGKNIYFTYRILNSLYTLAYTKIEN